MVRQWQEFFYQRRYAATPLVNPDFVKLAAAYGIPAIDVSRRADVIPAVQSARTLKQKHDRFMAPLDVSSWQELRDLLPDPALNPEQEALWHEKYERLHARLGRLSPQERQCLHLRTEGFRYREIAEVLEIATPTVAYHREFVL